MRKLWQTSKAKMGEESIKSMKSHTQKEGYCQWLRVASFQLDKNFIIVLVYAKCSKLITLEKNIISVQ